jgi:hypothetical protein
LLLRLALRPLLLRLAAATALVAASATPSLPLLARLRRGACALLELTDLALHVLALLRVVAEADLVVAAIRAALPTLRVGLLARRADDAFWQRHGERGAHCTLRAVTAPDDRLKTIRTLISLAEDDSPNACWDDQRAQELLRRESSAEECRELGMSDSLIEHVFGADSK